MPMLWIRRVEHAIGMTFDLDVCAEDHTARAPRWYTIVDDGLRQPWNGLCWCNPPFNGIGPWVARAFEQRAQNVMHRGTVFSVPANRTERPWWQRLKRAEADGFAWRYEPPERINYIGGPSKSPFPTTFWAYGDGRLARIRDVDALLQPDMFATQEGV